MSTPSLSCFLVLLCAIFVASDGCNTPGCPNKLEAAVIHCSNVKPGSFFMRCLTNHPPGSGMRRNCLNRAGSPQLDVCGDPKMNDMQVLSCFEKAAASVPWEYCVMSHFLRATKLESAVMECSDVKPGMQFMNCLLFEPWSPHRLHCFNGAGVPQLLFCGDYKKSDEQVLDCFEKAPASIPWEKCVIKKFKESKIKNPPERFSATIEKSGNAVLLSGSSTCSVSEKQACAAAGGTLKTHHCGEDLRYYKPWKWLKFSECEACSASCYDKVSRQNLQKILGSHYCGKLCYAAGVGALRGYCDHYNDRCAKYAKRKQNLQEGILNLLKKLRYLASNKAEQKCRDETGGNCNIGFE